MEWHYYVGLWDRAREGESIESKLIGKGIKGTIYWGRDRYWLVVADRIINTTTIRPTNTNTIRPTISYLTSAAVIIDFQNIPATPLHPISPKFPGNPRPKRQILSSSYGDPFFQFPPLRYKLRAGSTA